MSPAQDTQEGKQGCVVLIDDVPESLHLLTTTLRQHNYLVLTATSGPKGLQLIQTEQPDLILLDLLMPDMDGLEVCRRLKEQPETARIPIIFLTGSEDPEDIIRAFHAGGVDYVSKPYSITELLARISTQIRLRRADEERWRIERRLCETQKLESLAVLAGGIAHDFNNLLTVILGGAELAEADLPAGARALGFLQQIASAARRAAVLCEQMLAYSGRGRFHLSQVDLGATVRGMANVLRHPLPAKAALRLQLADQLPAIQADETQVRQLITNLILNAAEALGTNGGTITLATGSTHADRATLESGYLAPDLPEGEYVFLEVQDTGCGMSPEVQARIFDPFFTTKFVGRGLGLAAVLGIVRGHNGTIQVESESGKGSLFRVLLPRGDLPQPTRTGRFAPPQLPPDRGGILVVDDEEQVRKVIGQMLGNAGYTGVLAGSGQEALNLLRQPDQTVRLVLLDLTMPEMDGVETFRNLHLLFPGLPVVLMSGYTEEESVNRFRGGGLSGFIQKPFKGPDLVAKVWEVLQKPS